MGYSFLLGKFTCEKLGLAEAWDMINKEVDNIEKEERERCHKLLTP